MSPPTLRRSALYTPATDLTLLLKAARSQADVLIFDLEDAVAPQAKALARTTVARALADDTLASRQVVVRVNGLDTPWCRDDVARLARSGATGILFPKINGESDARKALGILRFHGCPAACELWCMVETAAAFMALPELARLAVEARGRLTTWVLGTNDLVKELRALPSADRSTLLPLLSSAVVAARAAGVQILDGVHNDLKDLAGFEASCMQGRELGFDGRTLVHPSQVLTCNRIYAPSLSEVTEAREIMQAWDQPENHGKAVIQVRGRMVELLHLEVARRTMALAHAAGMA